MRGFEGGQMPLPASSQRGSQHLRTEYTVLGLDRIAEINEPRRRRSSRSIRSSSLGLLRKRMADQGSEQRRD